MTLLIPGIPESIGNIVQDRTLQRVFHDSLYPLLLWRGEAAPEKWVANIGERQVFTRAGLIEPDVDPITPGLDPSVGGYGVEQWEAEVSQYGKSINSHLPTNGIAMAPTVLRDTQQLGLHGGMTLNRLPRNRIMAAYGGGEAMTTASTASGVTQLPVSSLNGFTQKLVNGRLTTVSTTNPLPITFSTSEVANTVIGYYANDATKPLGAGILILGAGLSATVAARVGVRASTRSPIYRVGAGATVDSLTSSNIMTVQDIINAVAMLRANRVPPHADGTYHAHVSPTVEAQLFADNAFQRIYQSIPDNTPFKDLVINRLLGCTFYRNTESLATATAKASMIQTDAGGSGGATLAQENGLELTNANGLPINYTVITAGGVMVEKYIDESAFISEAGVTGKIGQFSITNGGLSIMLDRIRFVMRAPLDALQQQITQSWSWSGDFAIPSDALTGSPARFKRGVLLQSA